MNPQPRPKHSPWIFWTTVATVLTAVTLLLAFFQTDLGEILTGSSPEAKLDQLSQAHELNRASKRDALLRLDQERKKQQAAAGPGEALREQALRSLEKDLGLPTGTIEDTFTQGSESGAGPGFQLPEAVTASQATKQGAEAEMEYLQQAETYRDLRAKGIGDGGKLRLQEVEALVAAAAAAGEAGDAERSLAHSGKAADLADQAGLLEPWQAAQYSAATALRVLGRYVEAEALARAALGRGQGRSGDPNTEALRFKALLADILGDQGRQQEAYVLHYEVFQVRMRSLGTLHPHTLSSILSLVDLVKRNGDLRGAEAAYRHALILLEGYPVEHPLRLECNSRLANTLKDLGRYPEAESLHREVLVVRTRLSGEEAPETRESMANLGMVLRRQRNFAEAAPLLQGVAAWFTLHFGMNHPKTLIARHNYAALLSDMGRLIEAEAEYRAIIGIRTRLLGSGDPLTLSSRLNLAGVIHAQYRYEEAEREFRAVRAAYEQALGPDDLAVAESDFGIATALAGQGRFPEAVRLVTGVEENYQAVLGTSHPKTLNATQFRQILEQRIQQGAGSPPPSDPKSQP